MNVISGFVWNVLHKLREVFLPIQFSKIFLDLARSICQFRSSSMKNLFDIMSAQLRCLFLHITVNLICVLCQHFPPSHDLQKSNPVGRGICCWYNFSFSPLCWRMSFYHVLIIVPPCGYSWCERAHSGCDPASAVHLYDIYFTFI